MEVTRMTEQTLQPEVLGGTEEQTGRPIPQVSEVSAAETPSGQQVDMDALAEKLADKILPKFEEQAKRRAQGIFDKTSYQFETMAEYLKAAGGDPKKAARDMALDKVAEREMARQSSEPEAPGRTKGEDPEKRTEEILKEIEEESGIRFTRAELDSLWTGKEYRSWDEAKKDMRKAAFKKAKGEKIGAGAVVSESGVGVTSATEDELARELRDIQEGRRGSAISPENKKRRAELKAQLASQRR